MCTQAQRIAIDLINPNARHEGTEHGDQYGDKKSLNAHVLLVQQDPIEAEDYWDIFEGYFKLDGSAEPDSTNAANDADTDSSSR